MENTKEKKNCTVRCTGCKTEATGESLKDILSSMRCGQDGGPIDNACRATLRSDGKNLFEVVPCKGTPDLLKDAKDKAEKDAKIAEEAAAKAAKEAEKAAKDAEKNASNDNDTNSKVEE